MAGVSTPAGHDVSLGLGLLPARLHAGFEHVDLHVRALFSHGSQPSQNSTLPESMHPPVTIHAPRRATAGS